MHGVHLSGEVHRGLGRDQPQRGPSAGRYPEPDPPEEQQQRVGESGWKRNQRGWRPLVQVEGCGSSEHEGQTDVDVAVRQRGQQVQELREPSRPLRMDRSILSFSLSLPSLSFLSFFLLLLF